VDLRRRTFLKLAGATTAGSFLPGCKENVHQLVPYLLPDDQIVPGVADWYASVCGECPAGCGVLVRVMEGRAKKIEGNPSHPINRGKLCARGHASLQRLYNPDRIRGPLKRAGKRGEGRFEPISWDEGIASWRERLETHRGHALMLSGPLSGTTAQVMKAFMEHMGGPLVIHDPWVDHALISAVDAGFGRRVVPDFDLAESDYVLSFGAPLLEHWLSPVAMGIAYGQMRQGRPAVRGRLIQIEPRMSLSAANADRWIPIRPGTEGLLAIGIGQLLLKRQDMPIDGGTSDAYRDLLEAFDLSEIARRTEIGYDEIERLAVEFGSAQAPVAIAGGPASAHTNGTAALTAVNVLNLIRDRVGKPGGVRFYESAQPSIFDQKEAPISERGFLELIDGADAGRFPLVHLHHCNPLHTIPPSIPVRRLFERAEFIVSFDSFMDESTDLADLILPDHVSLEAWSDHEHLDEGIVPTVGLGQPVLRPLYDTRAVGDVMLEVGRSIDEGVPAILSHETIRDAIRSNWETLLSQRNRTNETDWFETAWIERLKEGGWWGPARKSETPGRDRHSHVYEYESALFDGDATEFPFYFYPYPSLALGYGEGANLPWLQEMPDPLTTVVWGTWAEINPKTAMSRGIRQGDLIRVTSPHGFLDIPAVHFPGIRPDLIAVPIGQGHRTYGRYAADRGVNPLALLGALFDRDSGRLATAATRVRIEATGRTGSLTMIEQREMHAMRDLIGIDRINMWIRGSGKE
jgi:anaerobic selenocysteine-containing dehydrogenase